MPRYLTLVIAGCCLLAAACGGGSNTRTGDTGAVLVTIPPEPSVSIAVAPHTGPVICAADSTSRFQQLQQQGGFPLFCPTFLPPGFTPTSLDIVNTTPAGGPALRATFSATGGARVELIQGQVALTELTGLVQHKEVRDIVAYSDFPANLLQDVALARSPAGYTQVIHVTGLSTDDLRQIAAGMQPVPAPS